MLKFVFARTEYRIFAKDIAEELKLPYQEVCGPILWDSADDHLIIQNPRGMEGELQVFRGIPRSNRPRLTALQSEGCVGYERNGYGDAWLRMADIFDETFFLYEEDARWGVSKGYKSLVGGWGWIPSWLEREVPWNQRQDKIYFCGSTYEWWPGDLVKRQESIDFCNRLGILIRPTDFNFEAHADLIANCKVALCPEGHLGYQSAREKEAALAGTLILAYEDKRNPRWAFDEKSSVRLKTFNELKDFIKNRRWNDPGIQEKINRARNIIQNYKPQVIWRNIVKQF